jgi:chorismate--pyruvate lyase
MVTYLKNNPLKSQISRRLPAHFHGAHFLCKSKMPSPFREIFFHAGSMTEILKRLSDDHLTLTLLRHIWQRPQLSEIKRLSLQNAWGIGREVVLNCFNQPWMYARTFFPETVVKAKGRHFSALGSRPLGEILFSDPQIHRSEFSFARLLPGHREYQDAAKAMQQFPVYLWARHSQFYLPSGKIALLEVFSPLMEKAIIRQQSSK